MSKPMSRSEKLRKAVRRDPKGFYEAFLADYRSHYPNGKAEIERYLLSNEPLEDLRGSLAEIFDPIYAHALLEAFRWKRNMLTVSHVGRTDTFTYGVNAPDC